MTSAAANRNSPPHEDHYRHPSQLLLQQPQPQVVLAVPPEGFGNVPDAPWWVKVFGGALVFVLLAVGTGVVQHLFNVAQEQGKLLREMQAKLSAAEERLARLESEDAKSRERISKLRERVAGLEKMTAAGEAEKEPPLPP